jgi:hypothetical protein
VGPVVGVESDTVDRDSAPTSSTTGYPQGTLVSVDGTYYRQTSSDPDSPDWREVVLLNAYGELQQLADLYSAADRRTYNPIDVRVLASCQTDEINSTVSASKTHADSHGPQAWRTPYFTSGTHSIASDTDYACRGSQCLKISTDSTNAFIARLEMPEQTRIDDGYDESLPTLSSGIDCWLYIVGTDWSKVAAIDLRIACEEDESNKSNVLVHHRFYLERSNFAAYGIVPDKWCCLSLSPLDFQYVYMATGADTPKPWGWTDNNIDASECSYNASTDVATLTGFRAMYDESHVGEYLTLGDGTDRHQITGVAGTASGGLYPSVTVSADTDITSGLSDNDLLRVYKPATDYPVYSIGVGVEAESGETAVLRVGQIVAPTAQKSIFSMTLDEPFAAAMTATRDAASSVQLDGSLNAAVCGFEVGASEYFPDWSDLREWEAAGNSITSHSYYHTDTEFEAGTCDTDGTTVTKVSGDAFVDNQARIPAGLTIRINGTEYIIDSVTSETELELTTSAGTQSGVAYEIYATEAMLEADHTALIALAEREGIRSSRPWFAKLPNVSAACKTWGECTVDAGVVTITSGSLPRDHELVKGISIDGTFYWVDTVDSTTQVTLVDTTLTEGSAVEWWTSDGSLGVLRRLFAMSDDGWTHSYNGDSPSSWGSALVRPPLRPDKAALSIGSIGDMDSVDDVYADNATFREWLRLTNALGAMCGVYIHDVAETYSSGVITEAAIDDIYEIVGGYVNAGTMVAWNWDAIYAWLGGTSDQLGPDYDGLIPAKAGGVSHG